MNAIEIKINKRETMVFDDWDNANLFIESFTQDFAENIVISAPKEAHPDHIEMSAVFYQPREPKPQGQEVLLLDIKLPK
ncbi:hypothetical protein [Lactococcus termiticola]|uniref:Uncharacterized protein n=1 Tax=Lactococcus termiticola TaxID=2169526 RepID=A0A2R5HEH3_9LACT|nr:hypothetical protein [Lactococcus termiticola]GBG96216.1 hypothetical protein NtB2_00327 [Lactococcus termiticola]